MFTINNVTKKSDQCQYCSSYFLEHIGTQSYCQKCNRLAAQIQQQVRVVPQAYESNSIGKYSAVDKKVQQHLRNLSAQFGGIHSKQKMAYLCLQTRLLQKKRGMRSKGHRQNAAVVLYCYYLHEHKLSMKEYCTNNQIKIKSFNKRYIIHCQEQKISKKRLALPVRLQSKQKIEEESDIGQEKQEEDDAGNGNDGAPLHNSKYMIQVLFNDLFSKPYYQDNKNKIIDNLNENVERASEAIKLRMNQLGEESSFYNVRHQLFSETKIFYLIFAVIKKVSHKITIKKYIQIVKRRSAFRLKENVCSVMKRYYSEFIGDDVENSDLDSNEITQSEDKPQQYSLL